MTDNKIILSYIRNQERKLAEMKETVKQFSIAIPEIEAQLVKDKKEWGIKEVKNG